MNDYSTDLFIALTDWRRLKASSFQMSALYIYEFKNSKSSDNTTNTTKEEEEIKAIAFAGSYRGEIVRFNLYKSKSIPASVSFGHNSKVVDFASCKLPIILDCVASLSTDGTICLWNVSDGICVNKFDNLLPNGCQHIEISSKAVELCVVSGAFSTVYVIDIMKGLVINKIRPCNSFVAGIGFYSTVKSSWLFTIDCTGIATYTTLTPSTAKSHKIRLFSPDDFILFAKPNADFTYLIAASAYKFYFISLTVPEFTQFYLETECPIAQIEWVDNYTGGVLQMDGHFTTYKAHKPKFETTAKTDYNTTNNLHPSHFNIQNNEETHMIHAKVISKLLNLTLDPIKSSIDTAGSYQSVHQISRNTISNLDPFNSNEKRSLSTQLTAKPRYYTVAPQSQPQLSSNNKVLIPIPPKPSKFEPPEDTNNNKKKHHSHKDKNKDSVTNPGEEFEDPDHKSHHKKFNFFKRISKKMKNEKKHKTTFSIHHHHHHHKHDKDSPTLSTLNSSTITATTVFSNNYTTEDLIEEDVYSDSSEYDRSQNEEEDENNSEKPTMTLNGMAKLRSPCISGFNGGLVIGFDDTISVEKHDFDECSLSSKKNKENEDDKTENLSKNKSDNDKSDASQKKDNDNDDDESSTSAKKDDKNDNDDDSINSYKSSEDGDVNYDDENSDNSNNKKKDDSKTAQPNSLTAQCFTWTKKPNSRILHDKSDAKQKITTNDIDDDPEYFYEIASIVEGYNNGEVRINYLNQVKKSFLLEQQHKGKVVALFATQKFIFTSGADCLVHIYQIHDDKETYKYVKTLYQFTSPVIGFFRAEKETYTEIDHSLFCVTRGSIVSMLDLKTLENKRIMSGHDSQVKAIYFHPASLMLLIQCNSLYFWSLASSNLESIVTDHKKFTYLQNIKRSITNNDDQFIRIVPVMKYRSGILLQPLKIGSVVFQVPLINLEKFTSITRSIVKENINTSLGQLASQIPNFHFIYSLFASIGLDKFTKQDFSNVNKNIQFSIGLVGSKKVITLASHECQLTHKNIFNISSLVTSAILAAHALFSVAFNGYKYTSPISFKSLVKKELNQSDSALFFLLQYMFGCSVDVHEFLFKIISEIPAETKRNWINRLTESKIQFTDYHRAFSLIKCALAETMLDNISEEEGKADVNDLIDVIFSDLNAAPYARRIAVNNIDYFLDKINKDDGNLEYNKNGKGFFTNLVIKTAENASSSEADLNSLSVLLNKKPIQFYPIAMTSVNEGNQKAGIGFAHSFCNYIIDFEKNYDSNDSSINTDVYHRLILNLMYLFIKLGLDDSSIIFRKLHRSTKRITYSHSLNAISFASVVGFLYIQMKYQSVSIGDNCNLKNQDIKELAFDKANQNQIIVSYVSASKKNEQAPIKITVEKGVIEQNDINPGNLSYDEQQQGWVQSSSKDKVRVRLS